MMNKSLLLAAVIPPLCQQSGEGHRNWSSGSNPETRDWVLGLKNNSGGPCCDTADGFPVEVDGWDMAGIVDDTSGMTPWEAGIRSQDRTSP
jgi:hypothetical protein